MARKRQAIIKARGVSPGHLAPGAQPERSPPSQTPLSAATGLAGVASEALRFVLPAAFVLRGLLLLAWFAAVGWMLLKLSTDDSQAA